MNRKLIERILSKKHEDFCASIEDLRVRELVKKNSMITGGSIVSLLLGEKVSDYDYYFTDFETTVAVAQYYVDRFLGLNPNIQIKPHLRIDRGAGTVKIVVQSAGMTSEAGDVGYQYFENLPDEIGQQYVENVCAAADDTDAGSLDKALPAYRPVFMSANAITLSNKVQLVVRFWGDPEEVHKNYDFVHCCNHWLSADKKLTLNPLALESILAKQLYYQGSLYPVCSVIRMRKFMSRGWYINAGQILKMLFQISALDLTDIMVLEEQLTGVDAAYFHQVIDYCKKRLATDADFKVTAPYLVSVIDKIFG